MAEDEEHQIVGLNALLLACIVVSSLLISTILRKKKFSYLPDSGASMLLGFLIGGAMNVFGNTESQYVMFKPEVFFFILLPPIIFEAGFTMKKSRFFSNMTTILTFAVFGTLVSTFVIGYTLYGLAQVGAVPLDAEGPLECLMFGALISAVDPVATLSILGSSRVHAPPELYSVVFGESVLNDAVAIVLFNTFRDFQSESFTDVTVTEAVVLFCGVSLGSIVVGLLVALMCSFLLTQVNFHAYPDFEFAFMFFFAYSAYCIAEISSLSGIMALFFCGIVQAHYAFHSLSPVSRVSTKHAFKSFALVSETFLFAYLGITAVVSLRDEFHLHWSGGLIFFTIILCILSRAVHIFPFSLLLNLRRRTPLSWGMQVVMWFAGLRGAIAFALALTVDTVNKSYIVTTTMSCVIFTTLVCGSLTVPLLGWLGMGRERDEDGMVRENEVPLVPLDSAYSGQELEVDGDGSVAQRRPSAENAGNSVTVGAGGPRRGARCTRCRMDGHQHCAGSLETDAHGDGDEDGVASHQSDGQLRARHDGHVIGGTHRKWMLFDEQYMRPWFGGHVAGVATSRGLSDDDRDRDSGAVGTGVGAGGGEGVSVNTSDAKA